MIWACVDDEIGTLVVHAEQGEARVFCKRINCDTSNDPCAYLRHSSVGLAGIHRAGAPPAFAAYREVH